MTEHSEPELPPPDPRRTALKLGALFVVDLLVIGQGIMSFFAALIGAPLLGLLAAWSFLRSSRSLAVSRAVRASLFVLLGVGTYGAMGFHTRNSEAQAEKVIRAARAYEEATGALPMHLSDLVPDHLTKVPRARFTMMYADFIYIASESSHVVGYVVLPPFGRRLYGFETGSWGTLD